MLVTNTNSQQNIYSTQSTTKQSEASTFDKALSSEKADKTKEIIETKEEKKVDRMSFEFIKNLEGKKLLDETLEELYPNLSEDERTKIAWLHHTANLSENEVLNKTLFDKAKEMSPKDAGDFYFKKASEMFHYKNAGTANLSLAVPMMLEKSKVQPEEIISQEIKLSHEEAFNMLLDMINSSQEGMETSKGELQDIHEQYYKEYSELFEAYKNELRNSNKSI